MKDDGVLCVCGLENASQNGLKPEMVLHPVAKYWFRTKTVGMNRQYLAKGVNEQVDFLVSIPCDFSIRIGQYAVFGNGDQFRITNVQHFDDDTELRRTELSLMRLEEYYAVSTPQNC